MRQGEIKTLLKSAARGKPGSTGGVGYLDGLAMRVVGESLGNDHGHGP